MATESYKSFNGGVIPGGIPEVSARGKIHRIALWDVSPSDPTPRPLESWVIDLEDPNTSEPSGYSKLTVSKANEIHRNGEVFGLRVEPIQNPYDDNLLIETKFSSYSGTNLEIRLSKVSDQNVLTEYVILDYDQLAGISEHSEVRAVPDDSISLKKNKIHRYSFGDGVVDGETPVYGLWLIDLDKPDPNGPEGYARVTPAEFWQSTAVNGEVPVYLQDKNTNNSLTYAYLSRTDVTKSDNTVTNVFAYFVRSGYGNDLSKSYGFRFTKYPGSDYLQRASAMDDTFTALESTGDGKDVTVTFSEASERTDIGTGEKLSILFGKIMKWFSSLKAVAFSGSYNDLSHTPTIPAAQVQSDWSQSNSSAVDYIKNKPSLASVATSGSYNDLLDKPTIGVVMSYQSSQSVDHTVTSSEVGSGNIRIPLSHYDRGEYLLNIQLYAGGSSHFGSNHVPLRVSFRYRRDGSDSWSQEYTGALIQLGQSGPWYYGSTIRLGTNMAGLTGIEVEFSFGANNLVENDTIGVNISYLLLSEPS